MPKLIEKCTLEGCERPYQARGMCTTHYARERRLGHPGRARIGRTVAERFWEKVDILGDAECWPWNGHVGANGYGQFSRQRADGSTIYSTAHRTAYEIGRGPFDPELTIDHLCENTRCMNPSHLEPVTQSENSLRRWRRAADRADSRAGDCAHAQGYGGGA